MLACGHFAPVRWTAWMKLEPSLTSVIPLPGTHGPQIVLNEPYGS